MDWIEDFLEKFKNDEQIIDLKERRFYGNIQINFFDGKVVDVNKRETRKPTLKQGG